MADHSKDQVLTLDGVDVKITSPDKVLFPAVGITKRELVDYYVHVAAGALKGIYDRPIVLKRFVHGADGEFFFQKRIPKSSPDWLRTVRIRFPSGREADELVVTNTAQLIWMIQQGCLDLNPHASRTTDLDHPDELRVDLDPCPNVVWSDVIAVALVVREVLEEHGLIGWPKTSGSRGMHINVRIESKWSFEVLRRAVLALAREVERRVPKLATSKWWKEERHGVFLDYNQNARDRTVASAYSVRPVPQACVSAPVTWEEVPHCQLEDFTVRSMIARYRDLGDVGAGIDEVSYSIESLLELSARQQSEGDGDAPWPPHYPKQASEPARVQPSRRKHKAPRKPAAPDSPAESSSSQAPEELAQVSSAQATGRESPVPPKPEPVLPAPTQPPAARPAFLPVAPIVEIARGAEKPLLQQSLDAWRNEQPDISRFIRDADILWDRIGDVERVRVNLRNVPLDLRRRLGH